MRFLIISFLLLSLTSSGQMVSELFYSDSTYGHLDIYQDHLVVEDGIVISGFKITNSNRNVGLVKVNFEGELQWSTFNILRPNNMPIWKFDINFKSGDYIYGHSFQDDDYYGPVDTLTSLWKINNNTGAVEWIDSIANYGSAKLIDYDSNTYIGTATVSNIYPPEVDILSINKKDGRPTVIDANTSFSTKNLEVDFYKNLYASSGSKVIKYHKKNWEVKLWEIDLEPEFSSGNNNVLKIYFDDYNDLYIIQNYKIFGFSSSVRFLKINPNSGEIIWASVLSGFTSPSKIKLVDKNGKLYYGDQLGTASATSYFRVAQIDKETGVVNWKNIGFGSPAIDLSYPFPDHFLNSLDVDCDGNVYTHGDVEVNNEDFSICGFQKFDSLGSEVYQQIYEQDTSEYDFHSNGHAVCLKEDTLIILAGIEDSLINFNNNTIPNQSLQFMSIDKVSGNTIFKKDIDYGFVSESFTKDIQVINDSIYVLKQKGKYVELELYNENQVLLWSQYFMDSLLVQAGHFQVVNSSVLLTTYQSDPYYEPLFFGNDNNYLTIHKLDKLNGNILQTDTFHTYADRVEPVQLIAEGDSAFVFFENNDNNFMVKWDSNGIGLLQICLYNEYHQDYEKVPNILVNPNTDSLFYLYNSALISYNKSSLDWNELYFHDFYNYFDYHLVGNDSIYMIGRDGNNHPLITLFSIEQDSVLWNKTYGDQGSFYNVSVDSGNFMYISGDRNNQMTLSKISIVDGILDWQFQADSLLYNKSKPFDVLYNNITNSIALVGAEILSEYRSNSIIKLFDLNGNQVYNHYFEDELYQKSRGLTIGLTSNGKFIIGGSKNTVSENKQGFIYNIETPFLVYDTVVACNSYIASNGIEYFESGNYSTALSNNNSDTTYIVSLTVHDSSSSSLNIVSCEDLISPSENFIWSESGIYHDTISNYLGCDSFMTINLTIVDTSNLVYIDTACSSFIIPTNSFICTESGIYYDTVFTSTVCGDSLILTYDITILETSQSQFFDTVCYSYTANNGTIYSSSGVFFDTIPNVVGCDSIIELNLIINNDVDTLIHISTCSNYVSPSGLFNWNQNGLYQDTLTSISGCDSIINIDLTILEEIMPVQNISSCNSYVSPSGEYNWTASGLYTDTLINTMGCDSIVGINLSIYSNTYDSITVQACEVYQSPSSIYNWTTSGYYQDTISNIYGCDSILTIDLLIVNQSIQYDTVQNCEVYISPSGMHQWSISGTYFDTISTVNICDSIIQIELTILEASTSNINETVCDVYHSPSGQYTWTETGIYTDTLLNNFGCDSIISINLTVLQSLDSLMEVFECEEYLSPSGNDLWNVSGLYFDTLMNIHGCDSIIPIQLSILEPTNSNILESSCGSYISPSGKYNWFTSGIYLDTIQNSVGCDSFMTINLTINQNSYEIIDTTSCDSIISPSGNFIWTETGNYQDTIPNMFGCDSVISLNTTINVADTSVIFIDDKFVANATGATYQWIDCSMGFIPIPGQTNQEFTPSQNGSYALSIIDNGCESISECFDIMNITVEEYNFKHKIKIYPNPTKDKLNILFTDYQDEIEISFWNTLGQKVSHRKINGLSKIELNVLFKPGVYVLQIINSKNEKAWFKVVKE